MNTRTMSFFTTCFLVLAITVPSLQAMETQYTEDIKDDLLVHVIPDYLNYIMIGGVYCGMTLGGTNVMKSNADHSLYNIAYPCPSTFFNQDIEYVQEEMGAIPYCWRVPNNREDVISALKNNGFSKFGSESTMILDLVKCQVDALQKQCNEKLVEKSRYLDNEKIQFKKAVSDDDFNLWIETSARGFGIDVNIHRKFIEHIKNKDKEGACSFYLGYTDCDINNFWVVSTCLMIKHKTLGSGEKFASLHLLSTVPDYRRCMFGTFISLAAIKNAKTANCTHMVLTCPDQAALLFYALGFKYCTNYNSCILTKTSQQDQNLNIDPQDSDDENSGCTQS